MILPSTVKIMQSHVAKGLIISFLVTSSYKNPGINEYIMRFSSMQEVVWQYVHGYVGIMLVTWVI